MNKLKLHLEALTVESFDTSATEKAKGTVFGEQCTCYTQCTCPGCPTCANYNTCDNTCNNTCPGTCAYTCDDYTCAYGCGGTNYSNCDCTQFDATCNGYGTCGVYPCKIVP
ncbi:MAG TPA: hypothetical protein VHG93_04220 [Longimicrobium sp.]|nr:hypothetical protein [Longimicrobium sp.]